ncbi:hypothetical protein [Solimonas marina]|uniref:Uncharacterized protein n=1 Tax=Solimonas marina TaxID=2714601 RepID=A0A969WCD3_9GAMM|nr:hypothetical protein [Solimonas marina]NKF23433.1 hypothetical protein [Solimonas marina]
MSSDVILFPFIDPAVQIIVICAAAFVVFFFLSALSDVLRMRRHAPRAERSAQAAEPHASIASNSSP